MRRLHASLRGFLTVAMLMAMMALTVPHPVRAQDAEANRSEMIRKLLPTVVNISVKKFQIVNPPPPASAPATVGANIRKDPDSSIKFYVGSGFVIDPTGLILTNYHVVEDAFEISVTFSDGRRLQGTTASASRVADLAIVKVQSSQALPSTHWGDSDQVQVGDQVLAAGNPFGIGLSVSAGIVSGLNRDLQDSPYDDLIQTDATINHGNSGGPLFDMHGNVVGVNSDILSPTQGSSGLGFAIPSSTAHFVVDRLQAYGWVRPGWVGLKVQQVTGELAEAEGAPEAGGSIVCWVIADGPAKKAGLDIGDVILRFNGKVPSDDRALLRAIAQSPVGDTINLLVRRGNEERNISMVPEEWPRNQWDARDAPVTVERPKIVIPPDLGLSLSVLAPEDDAKLGLDDKAKLGLDDKVKLGLDDKVKLGLEGGIPGVLVSGVAADSDPAQRGMVPGDIILRVQNSPVATPDDVLSSFNAARDHKRDYVQVLYLPKVRVTPGPKWVALQLGTANN